MISGRKRGLELSYSDPRGIGTPVLLVHGFSHNHSVWSALRALECPVLVVRGGVSAILREKVALEMVEEVLRAGRLVTLTKAGHAVMIDEGPGLLEEMRKFLEPLAVTG